MTDEPTPPFSGLNTTCPKCTRKADHIAQYDRQLNRMGRFCNTCKYAWHELPADVSGAKTTQDNSRTAPPSNPLLDMFKDNVNLDDLVKLVEMFKKGLAK